MTRRLLLLLTIYIFSFSFLQAQIWSENFSSNSDGDVSGDDNNLPSGSDWSLNSSSLTLNAGDFFDVYQNQLYAEDIDGEGVWTSESIDISSSTYVEISVGVTAEGIMEENDYLRLSYILDGGTETRFANLSDDFGTGTMATIVSGSSLQIIARIYNDEDDEVHKIDNITVTAKTPLYSRISGNWATIGTWSNVSLGGSSCGCTPSSTDIVVIGNNNTVTLSATGTARFIDIKNTGTLTLSTASIDLDLDEGSTLNIDNGGTLNTSGSVNADIDFSVNYASYQLIVNGNLNIDGDLKFSGLSSEVTISGSGSLTVGDDFELRNNFISIINNLSNTLTISDDILAFNGSNGSNAVFSNSITNNGTIIFDSFNMNQEGTLGDGDLDLTNNSTITMNGIFTNMDSESEITNNDGATFNYAGATFDADLDLLCNNGTNTFNYSNSGAQNIIVPTDAYSNVSFSGSGTKSTTGNLDINGNLTIASGVTLDVNNGDDNINLAGNWTNSGGTFDEGTGTETLTFDGSSTQTITNNSGETFNDVVFNCSSIVLNDPMTIAGDAVSFTSGIIETTSTNILHLEANMLMSVASKTNDNCFVKGPIRRSFATTSNILRFFPVGKNNEIRYIELDLTHTTSANTTYTAEYFETDASSLGYTKPISLDLVSGVGYWIITKEAGGSSVNATASVYYKTSDGVTVASDLRMAKSDGGGNWVNMGGTGTAVPTGTITTNSFSTFSAFTLANRTGGGNMLPVELINFSAKCNNNTVELNWATASELNNDFFMVQRSKDGEYFKDLYKVKGSGTTEIRVNYSQKDRNPLGGTSYYRLKQVDLDGVYEFSDVISVKMESTFLDNSKILIYPNPVNGNKINFNLPESVPISKNGFKVGIFNVNGIEVYSKITPSRNGEIIFPEKLVKGVYLILIKTDNKIYKEKFQVN